MSLCLCVCGQPEYQRVGVSNRKEPIRAAGVCGIHVLTTRIEAVDMDGKGNLASSLYLLYLLVTSSSCTLCMVSSYDDRRCVSPNFTPDKKRLCRSVPWTAI